jgi:hypothetical protein
MSEVYSFSHRDPAALASPDFVGAISFGSDADGEFAILTVRIPANIIRRLLVGTSRYISLSSIEIARLLRSIVKNESEPTELRATAKRILGERNA